jgi:hypothetical protein
VSPPGSEKGGQLPLSSAWRFFFPGPTRNARNWGGCVPLSRQQSEGYIWLKLFPVQVPLLASCLPFFSRMFAAGPPAPASAAPSAAPPCSTKQEAGVKQNEGQYKSSSKDSPLWLWRGQNCNYDKPSQYAQIYWYGSVTWKAAPGTEETCYFGLGDEFFFSSADKLERGVCLGFAHTKGHPYGVLAQVGDQEDVNIVKVELFRGLPKERPEPAIERAKVVVARHLQIAAKEEGTRLRRRLRVCVCLKTHF